MATAWLEQVFAADQVEKHGGVIRRQKSDVEKPGQGSKREFVQMAVQRGAFFVFETDTQMVAVFRETGSLFVHHWQPPKELIEAVRRANNAK